MTIAPNAAPANNLEIPVIEKKAAQMATNVAVKDVNNISDVFLFIVIRV